MSEHDAYLKKVAASSLFNSAASALATAVFLPFVIQRIGLQAYGLWAILNIFIGIAAALDFGIWKSLVFLLPRLQHSPSQLLSSCIALCTLTGLTFCAVCGALLLAGVPMFGRLLGPGNLVWWLCGAGCVITVASLLTNLARGMLEASFRGHWVNIGYGLLTVVQYGVAALIAQRTRDTRALILGSMMVSVVSLCAHYACLLGQSLRWQRPQRSAVVSILRYGGASFFSDAPVILLGPLISYLFVLVAHNSAEYGVFDIALRVATLAATTLALLSTPFFTIVSSVDPGARADVRRMISRHLRVTLALAVLGWACFLLVGKPMLSVFFKEGYNDIYRASWIMMLGTVAVAALEPVTRMLMGIGRLGQLSLIRFSMLGSALLCLALLTHVDPLDRFALSCAAGFGVSALGLWVVNRTERWGYSET
jgi:O-antigen/teichoic acid export membrane protein